MMIDWNAAFVDSLLIALAPGATIELMWFRYHVLVLKPIHFLYPTADLHVPINFVRGERVVAVMSDWNLR